MTFSFTELADSFDRIDEDNRRWIERGLSANVQRAATEYGVDDWRTTGVAIQAGLTETAYVFLAMQGRALVDVLRLGESWRKRNAGSAVRDVLRIAQVVPILGVGAKFGRLALAGRAATGGPMSCVVTGNTAALRLTGQRLFITLEELWQAARTHTVHTLRSGETLNPLGRAAGFPSPTAVGFPGLPTLDALVPTLRALGARVPVRVIATNGARTVDDVANLARQGRGAVPFGIRWFARAANGMPETGRHVLVAYRDMLGRIIIADQAGERTLAQFLQAYPHFTLEGYYLVENARWVTQLELAARYGMAARQWGSVVPNAMPPRATADAGDWIARHLEPPLYHMPGPVAVRLDAELRRVLRRGPRKPWPVRKAAGKPAGKGPASKPLLWDDPDLEGADANTRDLWRAIDRFGGRGTRITLRELQAVLRMTNVAFYMALQELDVIYHRIDLERSPADGGTVIVNTYRERSRSEPPLKISLG